MINEFKGEYRWLSNFWLVNIEYEGYVFPSVENAYQYSKTRNHLFDFIISTPAKAKKLGQLYEPQGKFLNNKLNIMTSLLKRKFKKGSFLAEKLIKTNGSEIIEGNTWNDTFWGVCDGVGENYLGKIIMEIREELIDV